MMLKSRKRIAKVQLLLPKNRKNLFHVPITGIQDIEAKFPLKKGWLKVSVHGDERKIEAPKGTEIFPEIFQ